MKWSFANFAILILGITGILVITFATELTVSNEQDYYTLKEATEAAMFEAIDIAYFRLTGDIKISQEKFVENFTRRFTQTATYGEGNYKIEFYQISESPPKVSLRILDDTNSYNLFNTYSVDVDPTKVTIVNEISGILDTYSEEVIKKLLNEEDYRARVRLLEEIGEPISNDPSNSSPSNSGSSNSGSRNNSGSNLPGPVTPPGMPSVAPSYIPEESGSNSRNSGNTTGGNSNSSSSKSSSTKPSSSSRKPGNSSSSSNNNKIVPSYIGKITGKKYTWENNIFFHDAYYEIIPYYKNYIIYNGNYYGGVILPTIASSAEASYYEKTNDGTISAKNSQGDTIMIYYKINESCLSCFTITRKVDDKSSSYGVYCDGNDAFKTIPAITLFGGNYYVNNFGSIYFKDYNPVYYVGNLSVPGGYATSMIELKKNDLDKYSSLYYDFKEMKKNKCRNNDTHGNLLAVDNYLFFTCKDVTGNGVTSTIEEYYKAQLLGVKNNNCMKN